MKKLALLFWEVFRISLFVVGGGYAIVAVADAAFARRGWTKEGELIDKLPVYQMIPGILAGHNAVYVGNKVAGRTGAIVAAIAAVLPSIAIFTAVAAGYDSLPLENGYVASLFTGMRSALAGVILAALFAGFRRGVKDLFSSAMFLFSLAAMAFADVPVWVALPVAAIAGCCAGKEGGFAGKSFRSSAFALLLFLRYGVLAFGGGYVLVPMYISDFVGPAAAHLQLPEEEFANLMALTQMTPGPIGVNGATFFGYRLAGVPGAVIASLLLLLPGSFAAYAAFNALDRFRENRFVAGALRGVRPVTIALMTMAFAAFAEMSVFDSGGGVKLWPVVFILFTAGVIMKKKLGIITAIFVCAIASLALRADGVTAEKFPDAHTVAVDDTVEIRYQSDGTYVSVEEEKVKALTERGRRELSTVTVPYSRRYGRAEIAEVEIIAADGSVRKVDFRSTLKEATDNSSFSMNIYDPLDKVLSCSVPGLKVGETRRLVVRRTAENPRVRGLWADIRSLQYSSPVLRARVTVDAPIELPLKSIALRNPLGNVTSSVVTNGSRIVYVWTAENSPQAFPEPDMPPLWTETQNLRVSTAAGWKEISRWYWNLSLPHMEKTNAAMTNKVEEIRASLGKNLDRGELVRAIYKFVSQEIRYMGLTMEDVSPGYAPHDVDITFDNRYGVCRDKAVLLVAMLRIAGIEAYPVLINAGAAKMDAQVPQPYFNHAIAAVAEKGGYTLMDPTDESSKDLFPSYLSDCSYLVARPEGEEILISPVVPAKDNAVEIVGDGQIDADGSMLVDYSISFRGVNDNVYRSMMLAMSEEERRRYFEETLRGAMPGAELVHFALSPGDLRDTGSPLLAKTLVRVPEAMLSGERREELAVGTLSKRFGIANYLLRGRTALEKRVFPLKLPTTAMTRERLTLDIGAVAGESIELPEETAIEGPCRFRRSAVRSGDSLTLTRDHSIETVEFDPEEYRSLREDIKRIEAADRAGCVFARNRLADADVRILKHEIDCELSSPGSWILTERVVKEVLTYEGKKSSAELKFDYNPSWKKIELCVASVSNRNGAAVKAGAKEINVMDASWVASAPRYPAAKRLVVNLPAVEIGSVIEYVTRTEVKDSPVPFFANWYFDSTDPVDFRQVTFRDWKGEKFERAERHLRRLESAPMQPPARFWRDVNTVSYGDFRLAGVRLAEAAAVEPNRFGGELAESAESAEDKIRSVRDWMARHVRVAGPSLYATALAAQTTDTAVVLKERYASRFDYIRTMCALLKGAGFKADIVFAASPDAFPGGESFTREFRRDTVEKPDIRRFANALCRVTLRAGGLFGFGGRKKVYYLGTENEYTPLGSSTYDGAKYFDPAAATFAEVKVEDEELRSGFRREVKIFVRENGAVDFEYSHFFSGVQAGTFAKYYAEMLPEIRERHHQTLLGSISQAASATSDLTFGFEGDAFVRRFNAYVPDYAVRSGGALTLALPMLAESFFEAEGRKRESPVWIDRNGTLKVSSCTIVFPKGFTEIEHLPRSYCFVNPADGGETWYEAAVSHEVKDGALDVKVVQTSHRFASVMLPKDYFALLKEWERIAGGKAAATITASPAGGDKTKLIP